MGETFSWVYFINGVEGEVYLAAMVLILMVAVWGMFHKKRVVLGGNDNEYRRVRDQRAHRLNIETRWQ